MGSQLDRMPPSALISGWYLRERVRSRETHVSSQSSQLKEAKRFWVFGFWFGGQEFGSCKRSRCGATTRPWGCEWRVAASMPPPSRRLALPRLRRGLVGGVTVTAARSPQKVSDSWPRKGRGRVAGSGRRARRARAARGASGGGVRHSLPPLARLHRGRIDGGRCSCSQVASNVVAARGYEELWRETVPREAGGTRRRENGGGAGRVTHFSSSS